MRRTTLKILIAFLTFTIGVVVVFLFAFHDKPLNSNTSASSSVKSDDAEESTVYSELTDIRKVDFKNFTYKLSCGSADKVSPVTVKKGEYRGYKDSVGDTVYLKITDVIFGDINGDQKDEAIVLYSCGSGASYVYIWGLIFTIKNNKPLLLSEIEGGNKGDGGFHKVKIINSLLVVERYQLPVAGSPCCPEFIETTNYKLRGRKLVRVGKQTLRKIESD